MGILSGNPQKEPLHYGEVFGLWSYLVSKNGCIAGYQTFMNHCGDEDLKSLLKDMVQSAKQEKAQVENVLKMNGIALPPAPPERPSASSESIPAGAKFNDPEIAAMLTRDTATGLVACSSVMGQAVREDIAAMFGQFHATHAQFGIRLLRMNKEKGWLVPPPLHREAPEAVPV